MTNVPRDVIEQIINQAINNLPEAYIDRLQNVAFIVEDEPTPHQRELLRLRSDQTLFGLYEGIPLSKRHGAMKLLPDKITIFQKPLESASSNINELSDRISRTVWHEVAHYYGLDHDQIRVLEAKERGEQGP
ncbi:MAG TPA: metallopeptidase family protein [Candidatus Saccharimonadales bacterium]|jgi:predicted Zn-dependent protease with MMP-like domain|nr:metallopeptidase family protein [Candidatus Saccharimonadales bacterium]